MKQKIPKIPVYDVKLTYRVRTKTQAKELVKVMNAAFKELINKWCNIK